MYCVKCGSQLSSPVCKNCGTNHRVGSVTFLSEPDPALLTVVPEKTKPRRTKPGRTVLVLLLLYLAVSVGLTGYGYFNNDSSLMDMGLGLLPISQEMRAGIMMKLNNSGSIPASTQTVTSALQKTAEVRVNYVVNNAIWHSYLVSVKNGETIYPDTSIMPDYNIVGSRSVKIQVDSNGNPNPAVISFSFSPTPTPKPTSTPKPKSTPTPTPKPTTKTTTKQGGVYDIGIPNLNGKAYYQNDMNVHVLWVHYQLKATGKYYQSSTLDETGNLGDITMREISKFMQDNGYRNHDGHVDQTVINTLANYLGSRRVPVYVGGYYEKMNTIMNGGSTGSMQDVDENSSSIRIKWVQTCLKELGYYTSSIDGSFGSRTIGALKRFQADHGFEQRSYVSLGVARALIEAYYKAGCNLNNLP